MMDTAVSSALQGQAIDHQADLSPGGVTAHPLAKADFE
jgi:hypothetical protein